MKEFKINLSSEDVEQFESEGDNVLKVTVTSINGTDITQTTRVY